jgi:hypothetical protein
MQNRLFSLRPHSVISSASAPSVGAGIHDELGFGIGGQRDRSNHRRHSARRNVQRELIHFSCAPNADQASQLAFRLATLSEHGPTGQFFDEWDFPADEEHGWTRLVRSTFVQPALVWLLRTFKSHSAVPEASLVRSSMVM